jgi:four helix bundle protein
MEKRKYMSYKNLEIWKIADDLVVEIYDLTLNSIPGYEKFQLGNQIRRSIVSVKANIVEGYGRRIYPLEYLRYLIIAQASLDETTDHILTLYRTGSIKDNTKFNELNEKLDKLGRKLNLFIQSVRHSAK